MPDGSSSAAPVINPGPRLAKKRTIRLRLSLRGLPGASLILFHIEFARLRRNWTHFECLAIWSNRFIKRVRQ